MQCRAIATLLAAFHNAPAVPTAEFTDFHVVLLKIAHLLLTADDLTRATFAHGLSLASFDMRVI
jgi:hypothetical protein